MKKSYNIISTVVNDNKYILFSTISKAIIELDKNEFMEFQKIPLKKYNYLSNKAIEWLHDNYFIIGADENERLLKNFLFDKDRLSSKVMSTYITFSTLCNFSCIYCYEQGIHCYKPMNEETLNNTIEWYERIVNKNNYKECKIVLFGGEPLLHKDTIINFIEKIKYVMKKLNVKLTIGMISNGYLLEPSFVEYLSKNGLDEIQITIDGPKEIHDKRRFLKNGTFDKIIKNIISAPKFNGRFLIRISFDLSNICEVELLVKYISKLQLTNDIDIYFAPIHQTLNQKSNKCSFCNENIYSSNREMLNAYIHLYKFAKDLGFTIPKYYTNGPCMTLAADSLLIAPNGDLYKCVEMIGIDNLCVGNVKQSNYYPEYYKFVSFPAVKKCILHSDCKYSLICGGGCAMQSYLNDENIKQVECQKKMFSQLTKELLKINYGGK